MNLDYTVINCSESRLLLHVPILRRRRLLHRKLKYLLASQKWTRSVCIVPSATQVKIRYDRALTGDDLRKILDPFQVSKNAIDLIKENKKVISPLNSLKPLTRRISNTGETS